MSDFHVFHSLPVTVALATTKIPPSGLSYKCYIFSCFMKTDQTRPKLFVLLTHPQQITGCMLHLHHQRHPGFSQSMFSLENELFFAAQNKCDAKEKCESQQNQIDILRRRSLLQLLSCPALRRIIIVCFRLRTYLRSCGKLQE